MNLKIQDSRYDPKLLKGLFNILYKLLNIMENDLLKCKLEIHSREEFEIRLFFELDKLKKEKNINFKIETYLFISKVLNINNDTYSKADFHKDKQNYLRYRAPAIKLSDLAYFDFEKSPLFILKNNFHELLGGVTSDRITAAIKEIKILGCILRERLTEFNENFLYELKDKEAFTSEDSDVLIKFINDAAKVLKKFRSIKSEYRKHFPNQERLSRYFNVVDDYLSHLIEIELVKLFNNIYKRFDKASMPNDFQIFIKKYFNDEEIYRKNNSFRLHFRNTPKDKERYLYFLNQYKKFIQSVLYLETGNEKEKKQTIFSNWESVIIDNTTICPVKIGNIKENVKFVAKEKLDETVLTIREETRKDDYLAEETLEDILLYNKEINFDIEKLRKINPRSIDITDILRYNLRRYLPRMNDPDEEIYYFDHNTGDINASIGSRCYFLTLIIKYTIPNSENPQTTYERYRLIIRKNGLEELELISSLCKL